MAIALITLGYVLAAAAFYFVAARGAAREKPPLTLVECGSAQAKGNAGKKVDDVRAA